jgi:hypothetical protein
VHLASLERDVDELAAFLDRFPNCQVVDMAARIGQLQYQSQKDRERVRRFFIKYQDRILYGSDMAQAPWPGRRRAGSSEAEDVWRMHWRYLNTADTLQGRRPRPARPGPGAATRGGRQALPPERRAHLPHGLGRQAMTARRAFLQWLGAAPLVTQLPLAHAEGKGHVRVQDGALSLQFDDQMRCRVVSLLGRQPVDADGL